MTRGTYLFLDPEHVSAMSNMAQVSGQPDLYAKCEPKCEAVYSCQKDEGSSGSLLVFLLMAFVVREVKSQNRVPGLPGVN